MACTICTIRRTETSGGFGVDEITTSKRLISFAPFAPLIHLILYWIQEIGRRKALRVRARARAYTRAWGGMEVMVQWCNGASDRRREK